MIPSRSKSQHNPYTTRPFLQIEQAVQESDKQILVRLRTEDLLEGEVYVEIDVVTHRCPKYARVLLFS